MPVALPRAGLSSYLCRLSTMFVNLSILGVVIHTTIVSRIYRLDDSNFRLSKLLSVVMAVVEHH
jgi:hypothetical protein